MIIDQNGPNTAVLPVQIAVEGGPHAGVIVVWRQCGSYLIGRAAHAHLPLIHDIVASLEHCRLTIDERSCMVSDLGGRQGTTVNGRVVAQSPLRSGDVIEVGMTRLRVTLGQAAATTVSLASVPHPRSQTPTAAYIPRAIALPKSLEIPGYTIVRKLGAGGMGVVHEAVRRESGARVAIKTIIPAPGTTRQAIELFRREMALLARLAHPRIVRYLDSGEHAGQLFLAMEYVECVDLGAVAQPLSQVQRASVFCGIICQVLEALQYAHGLKLVHRDVKPSNILVSRTGPRLDARLADFGLAKNFELAGLSQLTADDELRGTPAFMPWEQLRGSRYAKPTADIYSTAATLYFYLTGRIPPRTEPAGDSRFGLTVLVNGVFRSKTRDAPAGSATDFAGIPNGLADVLRQALSQRPKQRHASAAEMREALLPYCPQPPSHS